MFFSRPNINPFGWDLQALPTPFESNKHEALTSDERVVYFCFDFGWLTVKISAIGETEKDYRDCPIVFDELITPFGERELYPEQICEILGLKIKGVPVVFDRSKVGPHYVYDLSGTITTWVRNAFFNAEGALELFRAVQESFGDARIVCVETVPAGQTKEDKYKLWRQTTKIVKEEELSSLLEEKEKSQRQFYIAVDCVDNEKWLKVVGNSIIYNDYPRFEESGFFKFVCFLGVTTHSKISFIPLAKMISESKLETANPYEFHFKAKYETQNTLSDAYARKILAILERLCFSDVQKIDLKTGLVEPLNDIRYRQYGVERRLYSKTLRNWCLEKPNRYLGIYTNPNYPDEETAGYIGLRPLE